MMVCRQEIIHLALNLIVPNGYYRLFFIDIRFHSTLCCRFLLLVDSYSYQLDTLQK